MFRDRTHAGRALGERLSPLTSRRPVVVGLPRGGVPVAAEVARAIGAPLDVIVVRKLGIPLQPEVAMGAVGERGVRLVDWAVVAMAGVSASEVRRAIEHESLVVRRRARQFRGGRGPVLLAGRDVFIVDDGIATGSTMLAAVRVAREEGAATVTAAAPVAPKDVVSRLRGEADRVVVLDTPDPFRAVAQAYIDFGQVDDSEVMEILATASRNLVGADAVVGDV